MQFNTELQIAACDIIHVKSECIWDSNFEFFNDSMIAWSDGELLSEKLRERVATGHMNRQIEVVEFDVNGLIYSKGSIDVANPPKSQKLKLLHY